MVNGQPIQTRVKLQLSSYMLQKYSLGEHWRKFWFVIPPQTPSLADLLPDVWATLKLHDVPKVKVFVEGCYVPPQSRSGILREGDEIDIVLLDEAGQAQIASLPGRGAFHLQLCHPEQPIVSSDTDCTLKSLS